VEDGENVKAKLIAGFLCDVYEICPLLGYNAASFTTRGCVIPQKRADLSKAKLFLYVMRWRK
jgi:hypothetical protein